MVHSIGCFTCLFNYQGVVFNSAFEERVALYSELDLWFHQSDQLPRRRSRFKHSKKQNLYILLSIPEENVIILILWIRSMVYQSTQLPRRRSPLWHSKNEFLYIVSSICCWSSNSVINSSIKLNIKRKSMSMLRIWFDVFHNRMRWKIVYLNFAFGDYYIVNSIWCLTTQCSDKAVVLIWIFEDRLYLFCDFDLLF